MRDPWLAATLLVAAALRVWGLGHGLPFVYNPDEVNIMARALSVAQDPNPHYFLYPSFFFYFLFAVMGGLFVLGRAFGRYQSLEDFQVCFFEDPTDFYLAGRAVGVLSALLTIVLTYRLANRHFGRGTARAASIFLAVAYFHVRDAHYLKHDVPAGLLIIVALSAFDRVVDKATFRNYLAAGVAMGVAFATHYYTIFLAPALVLCHWMSRRFGDLEKLAAAAVTSALTFFLLSPFVLLDLPVALDHMRANRQVVVDRSFDAGALLFPSAPAYVKFLAEQGMGYLMLGLMLVGWVLMARRGMGRLILWGVFPALFFVLVSYTFFAGRYLNPIAPSLAVAAGVAIGAVQRRWGAVAATVVALVACAQPLYNDYHIDRLFSGEDTRTLARRWILAQVPGESAIAMQSYSVPLPQSSESFRDSLAANDALGELERRGKYSRLADVAESNEPSYDLFFLGRGDEKNRIYFDYRDVTDKRLEPLLSQRVRHVVLQYPPGEPQPAIASYFDRVAEQGRLLERVSPFVEDGSRLRPYMDNEDWPPNRNLRNKGPKIEIWLLDGR